MGAVVTRVLRQLQQLVTPHELQVAAGIGSIHPAPVTARVTGVWDQYRSALVAALVEPVRVRRDGSPDDPIAPTGYQPQDLAEAQVLRLIRQLAPPQVGTLQLQLRTLMELGATPDVLAGIAGATGLTQRQMLQVAAYLRRQRAAGIPEETVQRTIQAYIASLLRQRAGTIARYEAVSYTNALVHARGQQLNGRGSITKAWVSARDDRVDRGNANGICRVLDDGKRIPLEQAWEFDGERFLSPPGHIGCRCLEEIWDETAS